MNDKTVKTACALQGCASEQLKLVRRWLDELEGSNRRKAFELMNQVMDKQIRGSVMTQRAFRFTRQLLMILSTALALALVVFLEVTA